MRWGAVIAAAMACASPKPPPANTASPTTTTTPPQKVCTQPAQECIDNPLGKTCSLEHPGSKIVPCQ